MLNSKFITLNYNLFKTIAKLKENKQKIMYVLLSLINNFKLIINLFCYFLRDF